MINQKPEAGLYLIATPIGSARDITLRSIDILKTAEMLLAEDTRVLRKLMEIHGISLNGRKLLPYHDHNGAAQRPKILEALETGASVAFASDAGSPMIADPGYALGKAVQDAGFKLHVLPGPSAVIAALCVSGLQSDRFMFSGFLPKKTKARQSELLSVMEYKATLLYFESAKRLEKTLADIVNVMGPKRKISVCRELTKKFEEVISGPADEVLDQISSRGGVKGEIVLVVEPYVPEKKTDADIYEALRAARVDLKMKDAANYVAAQFGISKKIAYEMALDLEKDET